MRLNTPCDQKVTLVETFLPPKFGSEVKHFLTILDGWISRKKGNKDLSNPSSLQIFDTICIAADYCNCILSSSFVVQL